MRANTKDLAAGGIFILIGALFALDVWFNLRIGNAFRMGPGFFPLGLAAILIALGLIVALKGIGRPDTPFGVVPVRGVLILAAPVVFGLTVRGLGLVPALVLVIVLSSFASRRMTLLVALALTVGLTVFCVLVFNVGLGLPIRLFGPWFPL